MSWAYKAYKNPVEKSENGSCLSDILRLSVPVMYMNYDIELSATVMYTELWYWTSKWRELISEHQWKLANEMESVYIAQKYKQRSHLTYFLCKVVTVCNLDCLPTTFYEL